jgi:maltose O-acetyltransferase
MKNSSIFQQIMSGEWYQANDPELIKFLRRSQQENFEINQMPQSDIDARNRRIAKFFGAAGEDLLVITPMYCDYGCNIKVGKHFFANFNFTVLDEAPVTIGDDCFIGPNVSIYTACHSTDPQERNSRREWAEPVTIGDNVWIGGSVTILPGVSIGNNTTIGAGSVVTKDIPANVVAAGNPCRVIRKL